MGSSLTEWADIIDSIRLDEVLTELAVPVSSVVRGEHWSSCPLPTHPGADRSPSFSINEDSLLWNCFTCSDGGSLPLLVMRLEELDWDGAIDWLLPYSDGEIAENDERGYLEQLERTLERAESRVERTRREALPFYSPKVIERLPEAPLELLTKWNITAPETVTEHQIKYDEERRRYKPDKGEYIGPALVIPHFFGGKLVGYQERWLDDDRPKWIPKYTNSDDFPKRQTLYGWDGALEDARRGMPVIVVESTMTRARLWELGYSAVATFGASVTGEQLRLLRSLIGGVILTQDNDPAYLNKKGQRVEGAGKRAVKENANALTDYIPVEILPPAGEEKEDLADLDEEVIHSLIERRKPVFSTLPTYKRRT